MADSSRLIKAVLLILILVGLFFGFSYWAQVSPPKPHPASLTRQPPEPQFLQSFFRSLKVYEDAFAAAGTVNQVEITGGIVSHHFLARNLIARFFAGIDPGEVEQVILVGPDHYRRLTGRQLLFLTTPLPWKTPYGVLEAEAPVIRGLLAQGGGGAREDGAFRQDHGVYVLVPFIKRTFPRARLVPLILRGTPDYGEFFRLGENLRQASPEKTVLLVSSDFAHGVDAATAARLDRESLVNLRPLRLADLNRIQADARPGLAVLAGFLGPGPRNFVLVGHKTSADFGGRDPGNLTSYITAYYQEPREAKFTLLFLGDLMFDRGIRKVAAARGNDFIFQGVRGLLAGHCLVIANLEGPITSRPSVSLGRPPQEKNHYLFTFPPDLAPTLKRHHLNLVHLGNNHLLDFDSEGLAQTRKYLESSGVGWFGDPLDETHRWIIKPVNGVKLALVSYNQFTSQAVDKTLSDLKQVRPQADLVILYAHWDAEYRGLPGERTRNLAHLFIDQGADLVIGSHSHTVQPPETYQGKMIYYSLGNFIFDQGGREETRQGLALEVRVHPRSLALDFKEIPLLLEKNGQTTLRCQ